MRGEKVRGWRRIAVAMWGAPRDPQIYGQMDLDATQAVAFIERARAAGHHVTATTLVGRAVALALAAVPEVNTRLMRSRLYPRGSVDIFFITAVEGGHDLSGVKVQYANEKPAVVIAQELSRRAHDLKAGQDPGFTRSKRTMERLPLPVLRPVLRFVAWLAGARGNSVKALGLEASPFGSAMVSSVGMLGLPHGYSPIGWLYHVPILVLAAEIVEKPVVVAGRVESRPMLPLCVTLDHRYVDGWHISELARRFRAYFENLDLFEATFPEIGAEEEAMRDDARRRWMEERLGHLKQLRDEIRIDLHLGGMEARERWQRELEPRITDAERWVEHATEATRKAMEDLVRRVRDFRDGLREQGQHPAH